MLGGKPRLARCLQTAARDRRLGRRRARQHAWGSPPLRFRVAHRPARRGDHRRRPADQGVAAGRGGRLRPDRQSRAGPPADRRRADLARWRARRARARDGSPACRARGRSRGRRCRGLRDCRRSRSSSSRAATRRAASAGSARPCSRPAVANAIFAATGRRLRSLPFDPMAAA